MMAWKVFLAVLVTLCVEHNFLQMCVCVPNATRSCLLPFLADM